jgi:hypothetical protein
MLDATMSDSQWMLSPCEMSTAAIAPNKRMPNTVPVTTVLTVDFFIFVSSLSSLFSLQCEV